MLEVLVELRKQLGNKYDELKSDPDYDSYFEGKLDGLDLAWQMVDEVITKLEGV